MRLYELNKDGELVLVADKVTPQSLVSVIAAIVEIDRIRRQSQTRSGAPSPSPPKELGFD
jgi:hypothetical protein